MDYCILKDGIIENIIVCDTDEIAADFGAVASYDGARIGDTYAPPDPEPDPPSESDLILSTVLDHEERLCIMELNAE